MPAYYCKDASSEPCPERAFVRADDLDAFVEMFFTEALSTAPTMIDVVAAGRDLEQAQDEQAKAEAELYGFVENASALDAPLFDRGVRAREDRVERARDRVRDLSARVTRLPVGGNLATLWQGFDAGERRHVLAGFLGSVVVSRGAGRSLDGHVRVEWADSSLAFPADEEERVRVAAA